MLFLCDHASNATPADLGALGLPPEQFQRHIAWYIGAAAVTRELARLFAAPALLTRFSRLVIDPNRGADDPSLVMRVSDGAIIPGNAGIDAEGALGDPDPVGAIADALQDFDADEILLVTAPQRPSSWLRPNVVDRARRTFAVPIHHSVVRPGGAGR